MRPMIAKFIEVNVTISTILLHTEMELEAAMPYLTNRQIASLVFDDSIQTEPVHGCMCTTWWFVLGCDE